MQDGVFRRRRLDRICSWLFREISPQGIRPEGARSYGPWRTVERAARRAHWPTVTFTLYFLFERWVYQRSDGWLACRTSDARGLDRMRSVTQLLSGLRVSTLIFIEGDDLLMCFSPTFDRKPLQGSDLAQLCAPRFEVNTWAGVSAQ